jgi:transposase InsO family protein
VDPDVRDSVIDFTTRWAEMTEIAVSRLLGWLELSPGKFYRWKLSYGCAREAGHVVPRDHWILPEERDAIIAFHADHPLDGYRALTYMMIDADVVAVSPATTYRILRAAGVLDRFNGKPSKKGTGFEQPSAPHAHWHIDVAYLNLAWTFYYLCSILDGYSRFIVHWEIRESMRTADVETILQRAREKFPAARPRIISDNGPQFIARDFRTFVRESGMTHVRTSPYYPQSNGKIERLHKTLKVTTIRPRSPQTFEEAVSLVTAFVDHYNNRRLHSAIHFIAPADKLAGRDTEILALRDQRLEAARERRRIRRMEELHRSPGIGRSDYTMQPEPHSRCG